MDQTAVSRSSYMGNLIVRLPTALLGKVYLKSVERNTDVNDFVRAAIEAWLGELQEQASADPPGVPKAKNQDPTGLSSATDPVAVVSP